MSFGVSSAVDSAFWQQLGQRFTALRHDCINQSKRPMDAAYHPDGWGFETVPALCRSSTGQWYLSSRSPTSIDEFKSIAGLCVVTLGGSNTDTAWAERLDCLRRDSADYEPDHLRSDSWEEERRPEPDFEVVARGLLWPPPERRPIPEPKLIETTLGQIDDVCGASERVCRRLADEALKLEMSRPVEAMSLPGSLEATTLLNPAPSLPVQVASTIPGSAVFARAIPIAARTGTTGNVGVGGASQSRNSTTADTSRALTLQEAAKALRVSEDTVHRMRKRREIEMFKVGSQWRVLASEVIRVRQHRSEGR